MAAKEKCSNVVPLVLKDRDGELLRYSTCTECGGYLAILASGNFRTHRRVFNTGDARIAENILKQQAK